MTEINLEDRVLKILQKHQLPFLMDSPTQGDGNCFIWGILQQCQRPEIKDTLSSEMLNLTNQPDQHKFRLAVKNFVMNCQEERLVDYRQNFNNFTTSKTFSEYWTSEHMLKSGTWADHQFIQATAYFIGKDIRIHSEYQNQYELTPIPGNIHEQNVPCPGSPLHLAYIRNLHYQSIIPIDSSPVGNICEVCNKSFNSIVLHLSKSNHCRMLFSETRFLQLKLRAKSEAIVKKRQKQAESRKKQKETDNSQTLEKERLRIADYRKKQKETNNLETSGHNTSSFTQS